MARPAALSCFGWLGVVTIVFMRAMTIMTSSMVKAQECQATQERSSTTTVDNGRHLDATSTTKLVVEQSATFGVLQEAKEEDGPRYHQVLQSIQRTIAYMNSEETKRSILVRILETCQNRHKLCSFWQVIGECDKNKAYMNLDCALACQSCHHLIDDSVNPCDKFENAVPTLEPGGLNQMFRRIIRTAQGNITDEDARRQLYQAHPEMKDNMPPYTVMIHSRPNQEPLTEINTASDKSMPPFVITLEDFLIDEECRALIQLGYKYEY